MASRFNLYTTAGDIQWYIVVISDKKLISFNTSLAPARALICLYVLFEQWLKLIKVVPRLYSVLNS